MIPAFLRSVAAQVRDLVKNGRAVHVTEADAAELEMIAGLPWEQCMRSAEMSVGLLGAPDNRLAVRMSLDVTPADFAYAWLKFSRARIPARVGAGCMGCAWSLMCPDLLAALPTTQDLHLLKPEAVARR